MKEKAKTPEEIERSCTEMKKGDERSFKVKHGLSRNKLKTMQLKINLEKNIIHGDKTNITLSQKDNMVTAVCTI